MKNWNSKLNKHTEIKGEETKKLAKEAFRLSELNYSVKDIAAKMGKSESRIREYLRD